MFITTAGRTNKEMIQEAILMAQELQIEYIPRQKRSLEELQLLQGDRCIVVGKNRLELHELHHTFPFFFHPNSAMFRIKRIQKGENDPFIEAAALKDGMSVLDCTLGLSSDAITASFITGRKGKVTGVEGEKFVSFLVKKGLQTWDTGISEMNEAMKRIEVVTAKSINYLKSMDDKSFDCVYFDPMFEDKIPESYGIKGLDRFALHDDVSEEMIKEASRVAKSRVVLKDHYLSDRFDRFGFTVIRRKTSKFHYAYKQM